MATNPNNISTPHLCRINRRELVIGLAALCISGRTSLAEVADDTEIPVSLNLPIRSSSVPADFFGLSYESAQLANPAFFSRGNTQLISLFREFSPTGNLRLGGGSSEFTTYSDSVSAGPPPFEVFGPDTSKTVKTGTITSALALKNLREFLDATDWNCLYGLNLGQGSVENAVREAAAAHRILGPRLLAFQIGNEPDSFRRRYRPETYTPADYLGEWVRFHDAIVQVTPGARFAGPDISNKLPYLTAFAEMAPQYRDIVLLTSHYYAMGPAGNPAVTLDNLLAPDPKLSTMKQRDLHIIQEAQQTAHLPYRMSEGNSCWNGGEEGVSDTFASALWCASYLLGCMGRGWVGANLHGGGNGFYTPIAGAPSTGFSRRPEFFGVQFLRSCLGTRVQPVVLTAGDRDVEAFVVEDGGKTEFIFINKTAQAVSFRLPNGVTVSASRRLQAPALNAKEGVQIRTISEAHSARATAPPYTVTAFSVASKHSTDSSHTKGL